MNTSLKFAIFILISFLIISCSSESDVDHNSSIEEGIENRNSCIDEEIDRLAINENYSMIVAHCYDQGALIDVSYTISERLEGDKVSSLDLSEGEDSPVVHVFNDQIDNLNFTGNIYSSLITSGSSGDRDYCECKDAKPPAVDCVIEIYRKAKSCDSNFCSACSLVLVFLTESGETQTVTTSVVLLPNNY